MRSWGKAALRASLVLLVGVALIGGVSAQESTADGVYSSGIFELGDGQPPPGMPGMADIVESGEQLGPDWGALFNADGTPKDDHPLDAEGNPMGNGIPDYRELYGGRWVVFETDYVSLGTDFDGTVRSADGGVVRGTAAADHDIGNAYAYITEDSAGNLVVYAAMERLGDGNSTVEFEFSQDLVRLGHGGYGSGKPWTIDATPRDNDVIVTLTFTDGQLAGAEATVRTGDAWLPLTSTPGGGCNEDESLCALGNGAAIDGGPWPNFDSDPDLISANRFAEIGINVGALLGVQPNYSSICVRTPEDLSFGYFGEDN